MTLRFLVFALTIALNFVSAATTPAPGSPDRVAICDLLREHCVPNPEELPEKVLWVVDTLLIEGKYAWFSGCATFGGNHDIDEYFGAGLCVRGWFEKTKDGWQLLAYEAAGDVAPNEVWEEFWAKLPADFPPEIVSEWFKPDRLK